MRARTSGDPFSVQAIAGTHVVLLGMNADRQERAKGMLGFAIERIDNTENDRYFLMGLRTFKETDPGSPPGTLVSTHDHPIQAFFWGDYTAKPDHKYVYRVIPMFGRPTALEPGVAVEVVISTEGETGRHAVYFNRGVIGSQAYALKFLNVDPREDNSGKALKWLSRGLLESLLGFIGEATGPTWGLRGAFYEFQYAELLEAFGAARARGADVLIVFDAKENSQSNPRDANLTAIGNAKIGPITIQRTANPSYIAHNKFLVLIQNNEPVAVWTGSTNITENGLFGQSNVAHIVRDPELARFYLNYWEQLRKDPDRSTLSTWTEANTPLPQTTTSPGVSAIFSPRQSLEALDWYAKLMDAAKSCVCFTVAFSLDARFQSVLKEDKPYLRYVLFEKEDQTAELIRRDLDNRISVGSFIGEGQASSRVSRLAQWFSRSWLRERGNPMSAHVHFVHDKFMLIDPLGDDPIIISGSANFSSASTIHNDENMLIIRGDTHVSDIYLGEFMRLFFHFFFRDLIKAGDGKTTSGKPNGFHLVPDDSWTLDYFKAGSPKEKERLQFSGQG